MFRLTRCAVAILAGAGSAGAATLNVPGGYSSIQSAIDAAGAGDRIEVQGGVYQERIDYRGKNVSVAGQGVGVSIIDASGFAARRFRKILGETRLH